MPGKIDFHIKTSIMSITSTWLIKPEYIILVDLCAPEK